MNSKENVTHKIILIRYKPTDDYKADYQNPLYNPNSNESNQLQDAGWAIGYETQQFKL